MQITVTEEHLNRAIKEIEKGQRNSQCCVMAQAAKDICPDFVTFGITCFSTDNNVYNIWTDGDRAKVSRITTDFDIGHYEKIRPLLPVTITCYPVF